MVWLYVPALEASNLDLNQELMDSEPFVMSRGKPMRPQSLSRKWKKEQYMKRLYGLTLKPSTANLGVLKWISSLEASLVSPIQVRESYLEKTTQETYGRTLKESLARFDPVSCSWKTFQTSIIPLPPQSLENWPKWGLTRRGVLYALPTLAHPIRELDGSLWQRKFATPTVMDTANMPMRKVAKESLKKGNWRGIDLKTSAILIPTPTTQMNQTCESMSHSKAHRNLKKLLYPTPTASDGIRTNLTYGAGNLTLKGHVMTYPTPTVNQVTRNYNEPIEKYLQRVKDYKEGKTKGKPGVSLGVKVRMMKEKNNFKNGGRLNPQWVEWLMGWPIGWTDCEDAVTE